jgi:hypothetical protein
VDVGHFLKLLLSRRVSLVILGLLLLFVSVKALKVLTCHGNLLLIPLAPFLSIPFILVSSLKLVLNQGPWPLPVFIAAPAVLALYLMLNLDPPTLM